MSEFSRRSFISSAIAATVAGAVPARATDAEDGAALADDYSRGEIFQQFVIEPWEVQNASESQTFAIPMNFQFPRDVMYDCTVAPNGRCVTDKSKPRTKPMMFGIDINHYTDSDDFSFSQLRDQHVRFVQMKTSQGSGYRDDNFPIFWKLAGQLTGEQKIFRGPYHFLTAGADGRQQADWFLMHLNKAGGLQPDDMAPGVDLEWDVYRSTGKLDHWKDKGAQYIIDTALSCLDRIREKTGRTPILYTGKSWFGQRTVPLDRFKEFAGYPLWVFDYDPVRKIEEKPLLPDASISATLWQFTSSASIPVSYGSGVDASIFYGTEADFRKTFGMST
jgi:lysozyme